MEKGPLRFVATMLVLGATVAAPGRFSGFSAQGASGEPAHPGAGPFEAVVQKLVTDPVLFKSSLAGSGFDSPSSIAADADGNLIVTGFTGSGDFPTVQAHQPTFGGIGDFGFGDAFVAKINPESGELVFSTFLGGSGDDTAADVAVDSAGNVYVVGTSDSDDFPILNPIQGARAGFNDMFLAKFAPDGFLLASTFLGGTLNDGARAVQLDADGNVYVAGTTGSSDFPVLNAMQGNSGGSLDGFLLKLNPQCDALLFSTYLGGSDLDSFSDFSMSSSGDIFIAGSTESPGLATTGAFQESLSRNSEDAFVAKISPAQGGGHQLVFLSYLGGSQRDSANSIAVDEDGRAYVVGDTLSPDFPLQRPLQPDFGGPSGPIFGDGFLTILSPDGGSLEHSTYQGGSQEDRITAIRLTEDGLVIGGTTTSPDFREGGSKATVRQVPEAREAWLRQLERNNSEGLAILAGIAFLASDEYEDIGKDIFTNRFAKKKDDSQESSAISLGTRAALSKPETVPAIFTTGTAPGGGVVISAVQAERTSPLFVALPSTGESAAAFSSLALTSLSSTSRQVRLLERNSQGTRSATRSLDAGQQRAELRREFFGSALDTGAWAEIGGGATSQLASFFQFGTLDLSQLDGGTAIVDPSLEFVLTRVAVGPTGFRGQPASTSISLFNPGNEEVTVELVFTPAAPSGPLAGERQTPSLDSGARNGQVVSVTRTIAAGDFLEESVNQLFGNGFSSGYVRGRVTQGAGLAGFEVVQLESQTTVLGLNAAVDSSATRLYSAQLASQPGLFTNVNLINTSDQARQLTLSALLEDGSPVGPPVEMTLLAGEAFSQDAGTLFGSNNLVGSLEVATDGAGIVGDVIFGDADGFQFAAALALQAQPFSKAIFSHVANVPGFFTGLSFYYSASQAAPRQGASAANFEVEVFRPDGSSLGKSSRTLNPGSRISALVDELVPDSAGQAGGYVIVTSDQPLIGQMLFGALDGQGRIKLFSAVPPAVIE